jgi:MipA family protein
MKKFAPALFTLLCVASLPVQAQSDDPSHVMMPEGTTDIDLGLIVGNTTRSEGGRGRRSFVLPFVRAQWSNGVFLDPGTLGLYLPGPANLSYGPTLAWGVRAERADKPSAGTRLSAELGGFARYKVLYNAGVYARVGYGAAEGHRGVHLDLGASAWTPVSTHQSVSLGLGLTLADRALMQSFFGVTPEQGRIGGRPVYDARAGVRDVFASVAWRAELSTKYDLSATLGFSRLGASAAASPLTMERNRVTLSSSLAYHY